MYGCMHACTHVCVMRIFMHVCICVCVMYVCVLCTYIYIHIHIHIYTYIYIYTYTYIYIYIYIYDRPYHVAAHNMPLNVHIQQNTNSPPKGKKKAQIDHSTGGDTTQLNTHTNTHTHLIIHSRKKSESDLDYEENIHKNVECQRWACVAWRLGPVETDQEGRCGHCVA